MEEVDEWKRRPMEAGSSPRSLQKPPNPSDPGNHPSARHRNGEVPADPLRDWHTSILNRIGKMPAGVMVLCGTRIKMSSGHPSRKNHLCRGSLAGRTSMRSEELARPTTSINLGGQVRLSQILLLVDMFIVFPLIALRIVPYMIPYI